MALRSILAIAQSSAARRSDLARVATTLYCLSFGPGTAYVFAPGPTQNKRAVNGFGGKIPGVVIGGTNAAYGGVGFSTDSSFEPWTHSKPTFTFRDDAASVSGNHTVSFGVDVIAAQKNEFDTGSGANTGDVRGLLTVSNLQQGSTNGNAFATFLLGLGISDYQQDSTIEKYYGRYQSAEPYFQDDWRSTPRLTLATESTPLLPSLQNSYRNAIWNSRGRFSKLVYFPNEFSMSISL